nr:FkbM family methyltransferase [Ferrimicrobium acidiphilum]
MADQMPFVSYAQNFEDVMLWRALKHVESGFYIDIGAQDPVVDSVSMAFYEHGWRGVHIEPIPSYAERLRHARPDETVIQAALGSVPGVLKMFEIPDTGLSTGDTRIAEFYRAAGMPIQTIDVPCLSLASVLDRYADRVIHWLKIDAEGMEESILASWRSSEVRPWIVIVEGVTPQTGVDSSSRWEPLVLEMGYRSVYFDGLNHFYLSISQIAIERAFQTGPNVFDEFVLSGRASATFCKLLGDELSATRLESQRLAGNVVALEHELSVELEARQEVEARLGAVLETIKAESERLAQTVAEREREVADVRLLLEQGKAREKELSVELEARRQGEARLEADLRAVYASHSWRVTSVLRVLSGPIKAALGAIGRSLSYMCRLPNRACRRLLGVLLAHLRRHPGEKEMVRRLLALWPRMFVPLQDFATRPPEASRPSPSADVDARWRQDQNIDWRSYPVSVHNDYLRLRRAQIPLRSSGELDQE